MNELVAQANQVPVLKVYHHEAQALVPITQQVFLQEWAVPKAQRKLATCNNELACIDSRTPSIIEIKKAFGQDCIQAYIESWIVNLRLFFNVGRAMTDDQTFETAMLIVDTFPQLNIADINLIFKNAKLGRWGKIYDRLDGNIILEWFERYFDDRCEAAAERSVREADQYKGGNYDSPQRVKAIVDNLLKEQDKRFRNGK